MKQRFWVFPAKVLTMLICGVILGYLLLLGVYALPVEPMAANVRASVPAFNGEWAREESYETLIPGYRGTQLDNSTDAAMLLHAVHTSDDPITVRAAEGRRYVVDGNAFAALLEYGHADEMQAVPISRYWHGYLLLLKPLLCIMSYLDIRMLLTILQGGMLAAVIAGFCTRKLTRWLPAFLLSLLCITPSATGLSMQFSTVLCTMLGAMLTLLWLPKKHFEGTKLWLFFLFVGMCTSYFDYLTYPLAAFGMPFVLSMLLFPAQNAKEEWKRLFLCGFCWCVGYLGMWAGKWVIAAVFGSERWFWANLFAKIGERSSDVTAEATLTYGDVLKTVLGVFFKRAYALVGAAAVIAWIAAFAKGLRRKASPSCPNASSAVLAVIALLPFAWYFCTQNHSYIHAFYTSRNLSLSVFSLCCLFQSLLPKNLYKSDDL